MMQIKAYYIIEFKEQTGSFKGPRFVMDGPLNSMLITDNGILQSYSHSDRWKQQSINDFNVVTEIWKCDT